MGLMTDTTVDVLGWIGALALLLAYGLISAGRMQADKRSYQSLNLVGSAGLIVNSTWYGAYPSTFVNVIWIGIAIVALTRIIRRKRAAE
jgi:hypothetical protein